MLFYLNNPRQPAPDLSTRHVPVTYHDTYNGLQLSLRRGKAEFLNHLFIHMRQDYDVAVWSQLNNDFTNDLCHKYFTRYYRDLLFIMGTNRALYGDQPLHQPIKIRKELTGVFNRFPCYDQGNTVVVSAEPNLIEAHIRNDLIVPEYSPSNPDFTQDPGLTALAKYLEGLVIIKEESGISDIRRVLKAK